MLDQDRLREKAATRHAEADVDRCRGQVVDLLAACGTNLCTTRRIPLRRLEGAIRNELGQCVDGASRRRCVKGSKRLSRGCPTRGV